MDLTSLPITHEATIPPEYLDVMGHMNVMWYTHLFDGGIVGTFNLIGLNLDYMKAHQAGSFALESHVRYFAEVLVGDHVTIRSRFLARTEKRFHLLHLMTNDTQRKLAATLEVVGAHIDMKIRRMSPFPDEIASRLDEWIERHMALDWDPPLCGVMSP